MVPPQQRFGHYLISRNAVGTAVELDRSESEVVFLAFDTKIKRLVELHVLKAGAAMSAVEKRSALDRAVQSMEVRGGSFLRVLDAGEEGNMAYFASNLSDGEFAEDYVARRGALPPVTVFCLMQQFLDDLVAAKSYSRLVARMRVSNPLVTTLEDAFLQLRVVDYGFSEREQLSDEAGLRRIFVECCRLLFLLLTGQPYEGQNVDRFPALTSLPTNLRANMRTSLADPREASPNLERLRDDVKDAYAALVSNLQARTSRKHIAVTDAVQPLSQLQQVLLENIAIETLLQGRFDVANGDDLRRYPFAIPAANAKTGQALTVHLLPPTRIVERSQMEAVPLQMWRFNPERHPNVVRSLSLWENPEWTFLTEEREPGFTLSRLMAERGSFNPPEVLAILKQVRAGIEQAAECGVQNVDLHPSNLIFRVGKGGAMQSREFEKLITKRIDAWPPFLLKVRTHMTMRSLYEPLLVEPHPDSADRDWHLVSNDLRCRSFVGLGIYLLTGERQVGSLPAFGEAVPDTLAAYLRECLEGQKQFGGAPLPNDFIEAFEKHMPHDDAEGRGMAAIRGAAKVAIEDMESAGAVSDFDEETSESPGYLVNPVSRKLGVTSLSDKKTVDRGVTGMMIWGVAAMLLLLMAYVLFGGSGGPGVATSTATRTAGEAKETATSALTQPATPENAQSGAPMHPTPVMAPTRPRTPEEIRKAIKPSSAEVERALREKLKSEVAPNLLHASPDGPGIVEGTTSRDMVR